MPGEYHISLVTAEIAGLEGYEYQPLGENEIRVLVLEPGVVNEPLCASFQLLQLPAQERQEAEEKHDSDEDSLESDNVDEVYGEGEVDEDDEDDAMVMASDSDTYTTVSVTGSVGDESMGEDDDESAYEAISYAWGSADLTHHLTISGRYRLPITTSLFQALRQFRREGNTRRLWADAVCINQKDDSEKAVQVAFMGPIYSSARRTLVWLGESSELDFATFSMVGIAVKEDREGRLQKHGDLSAAAMAGKLADRLLPHTSGLTVPPRGEMELLVQAVKGLQRLFDRPWWTRLWVLQETFLAVDISFHSGDHTCGADDLLLTTNWVWEQESRESSIIDNIPALTVKRMVSLLEQIAFSRRYGLMEANLISAIRDWWDRGCSHPLDRIFAIRAVTDIWHWPELRPNYRLEPRELYSRVVLELLNAPKQSTGVADCHPSVLLALAGSSSEIGPARHDWPSWLCDLHRLTQAQADNFENYWLHQDRRTMNFTDGRLKCKVLANTSTGFASRFEVSGRIFAHLHEVLHGKTYPSVRENGTSQTLLSLDHELDRSRSLQEWIGACIGLCNRHRKKSATPIEAMSLPPDEDENGYPDFSTLQLLFSLICLPDISSISPDELSKLVNADLRGQWLEQFIGITRRVGIIRLASTSYVGFIPASARADDEICILYGARYPFVVRQRSDSDCYEMLGDAFFWGLPEDVVVGEDVDKQLKIVLC